MADTDTYEYAQIARLFPFFYPSSQSTPPDPPSTAARLARHIQATPIATASLAINLPPFLLYTSTTHPAHTDHTLHSIKLLLDTPSLPLINNWDSSRPNATFAEMFHVAFRDDFNNTIGEIEFAERDSYIAVSLLGARARSMGMLNTPEIVGSLAEGLGFPDEVLYHYQGDVAEIAAVGSCLQLLGGASSLVQDQPERFAKDKILAALDSLQFSQNDVLIKFTKSHLQKEPLVDLTSEEIVDSLKTVGY
ncbi:hypothetical protein BDZ97DRAFT_1811389 [Flammula alnicola]|nr:hypothetical protein BDZ97DRAFT_1811389 [Flammula alnicola]